GQKANNKLLVTWVGPYQVIQADEYSFGVRHLVSGDEQDVHASRLKFYADQSLEVTEEVLEHVASQGIVMAVESIKQNRWCDAKREFELLINWKGFESIEDSWEPMRSLVHDIPVLVRRYAESIGNAKLLQSIVEFLGQ
uniref:Chromo domain-containing protein n=1 Tax=Globisporangium ultimum (strain ATCC 200006 / CBS 805.95 / DAOM BR144) TaxID=431595 RepID=K3X3V1_GLOUD